ncbi:MAG: hypothetical protein NVS1B6_07210 [Steroidobacteraceae bacterium]
MLLPFLLIRVEHWTDILPPTLLVALGMAACVAPLTTAVMASVDTDHVGAASGFNSAVARIAGLVATALLGFVFARQGSAEGLWPPSGSLRSSAARQQRWPRYVRYEPPATDCARAYEHLSRSDSVARDAAAVTKEGFQLHVKASCAEVMEP